MTALLLWAALVGWLLAALAWGRAYYLAQRQADRLAWALAMACNGLEFYTYLPETAPFTGQYDEDMLAWLRNVQEGGPEQPPP